MKTRSLSFLLTVTICISLLFVPSMADPIQAVDVLPTGCERKAPEILTQNPAIMSEFYYRAKDVEPSLNTILYKTQNGENRIVYYPMNVKFFDNQGNIVDKSNEIVVNNAINRSDYPYTNKANDIKFYFPNQESQNSILIEYKGLTLNTGLSNTSLSPQKICGDTISYVSSGITVEYICGFDSLTRKIIVENEVAAKNLLISTETNGTVTQGKNGVHTVVDATSQEYVLLINAPVVHDATGNAITSTTKLSTNTAISRLSSKETLLTTLESSRSSTVTYPITISESYAFVFANNAIQDTTVYSGEPTTNYGEGGLSIGYHGTTKQIGRTLFKFPALYDTIYTTLGLTANDILSAKLSLFCSNAIAQYQPQFGAYQTTLYWAENSATWDGLSMGPLGSPVVPSTLTTVNASFNRTEIDLTVIVQGWMSFTGSLYSQYGVTIRNMNESAVEHIIGFYASEFSMEGYRPYLIMTFDQPDTGIIVKIKNYNSNKYMTVDMGYNYKGRNIYQKSADDSRFAQEFRLIFDTSKMAFRIHPICSMAGYDKAISAGTLGTTPTTSCNVVLDIRAPLSNTGENTNPHDVNQLFLVEPSETSGVYLKLKNTSLCLTANGLSDGTNTGTETTSTGNIYVAPQTTDANQRWILEPSDTMHDEYYSTLNLAFPFRKTSNINEIERKEVNSDFGYRSILTENDAGQTVWEDAFHYGIDFPANANTPLYSAVNGTVIKVATEDTTSMGYYIIIEANNLYAYNSTNKIRIVYMHLIRPSTLSVGTTVTTNTVVGYVGSSGNSSGNHLHMTILTDGTTVKKSKTLDPMMFYGDLHLVCTQGTD